jgi:anthranilate synthase component 1
MTKLTHMPTVRTKVESMLADTVTPVSLYLRLRDRYPGALLLESSDYHGNENSVSFLCLGTLAGFMADGDQVELQIDGTASEMVRVDNPREVGERLTAFLRSFRTAEGNGLADGLNGFFGYATYDAVRYFEDIQLTSADTEERHIPAIRYQLPRFILAINHFNNRMTILENLLPDMDSQMDLLRGLLSVTAVPSFPFSLAGEVKSNMADADFRRMVEKGRAYCQQGEVFQIVLSRQFAQVFEGDDFNVYRALRAVNPSPYLFYFDYGGYRLFGSSPEAQVRLKQTRQVGPDGRPQRKAIIHPIAGTFPRTGDDVADRLSAEALAADPKENAEHVMLVDLARNDLNRLCGQVQVETYREVQFYSHVIHLVSEVSGQLPADVSAADLLAETFPAGTLSGAPKHRAMQLIDRTEGVRRGFYGGCVGFFSLDGGTNHAILIRSFLSKGNTLYFQAGAGIVKSSDPEKELQEVYHKVGALRKAIAWAAGGEAPPAITGTNR